VLAVPALALDALEREIARIGHVAVRAARAALAGADAAAVARELRVVERLDAAVERFVERVSRAAMPQRSAQRLARTLRVLRYHQTVAEEALVAARLRAGAGDSAPVAAAEAGFVQAAASALALCDPAPEAGPGLVDDASLAQALASALQAYEALKSALLEAGATGALHITAMEVALRRHSALRRALEQAVKAARLARALQGGELSPDDGSTGDPRLPAAR
jgi:phosphate:Na+ symporter